MEPTLRPFKGHPSASLPFTPHLQLRSVIVGVDTVVLYAFMSQRGSYRGLVPPEDIRLAIVVEVAVRDLPGGVKQGVA